MKERPILFSGEMVRAILDDRKTMTRRVINQTPAGFRFDGFITDGTKDRGKAVFSPSENFQYDITGNIKVLCPYGQPGDRLWVRETFCDRNNNGEQIKPLYRADGQEYEDGDGWHFEAKWKPSIFMPRRYSRITLEITNIHVERLQYISEEDAKREGVESNFDEGVVYYGPLNKGHADARIAFSWLWDSINAKRGYSWESNPWVWVVEFKRVLNA